MADRRDRGQPLVSVRLYVEGGGKGSTADACREGFRTLFTKVATPGSAPKVIASGGRQKAYQNFCVALRDHPDQTIMLLVDSEGPVRHRVWEHLGKKPGDGWKKPPGVTEDQAHLMVQCMEAWFLADRDSLLEYYGRQFGAGALPRQPNVELTTKAQAQASLKRASRTTLKGSYKKSSHSFDLLARIDPAKVRAASQHAAFFFEALVRYCEE
jgi:hypothetical protein